MKQKFTMDSLSKFLICTDLNCCTYEKIKTSLLYPGAGGHMYFTIVYKQS